MLIFIIWCWGTEGFLLQSYAVPLCLDFGVKLPQDSFPWQTNSDLYLRQVLYERLSFPSLSVEANQWYWYRILCPGLFPATHPGIERFLSSTIPKQDFFFFLCPEGYCPSVSCRWLLFCSQKELGLGWGCGVWFAPFYSSSQFPPPYPLQVSITVGRYPWFSTLSLIFLMSTWWRSVGKNLPVGANPLLSGISEGSVWWLTLLLMFCSR